MYTFRKKARSESEVKHNRDVDRGARMIRSVLVAGMDQANNPFTKYVTAFGINVAHESRASTRELPEMDAAIVALGNCSHELSESVKRKYMPSGRPIFFSQRGVSEIKDSFEEIPKEMRQEISDLTVRQDSRVDDLVKRVEKKVESEVHSAMVKSSLDLSLRRLTVDQTTLAKAFLETLHKFNTVNVM